MNIPLYQIDAFTSRLFGGNPAAVCPLPEWLPDDLLQAIAMENNLSETAFLVRTGNTYRIRWFTPLSEVDLCGHATLAAAYVLFKYLEPGWHKVRFESNSGPLTVLRREKLLVMDFPAWEPVPCEPPPDLYTALGTPPGEVHIAEDYLAVYSREAEIRALQPDFEKLRNFSRGVIVTAPGRECDFVSRCFYPRVGINEDPVTGSAHCLLTPYWSRRLGKTGLRARQISPRGGELYCEYRGDRVEIAGEAVEYLQGMVTV